MNHPLTPKLPDKSYPFLPITCFIVKIASRCNLNCRYCYMYNLADKSYTQQPSVMSQEVVDATISRIREHAVKHGIGTVGIIFHGGEPLLAGESFLRNFVEQASAQLRPEVTPHFSMQTNATLLSSQWLETLADLDVKFGISLDGDAEANDANRVDHQGRGSYARVAEALQRIHSNERFSEISKSLLTVVNLGADPLVTYRHFRSLGVRGVDFLLPDGTYDEPPPRLPAAPGETPYADWLIPIFDEWFDKADGSFKIRFFENIIALVLGAEHSSDNIGGRKSNCIVIETDGGIEAISGLKACGEGFTKAGLNVIDNPIDDVYDIPLFRVYFAGQEVLCDTCQRCPIVAVCGGGYLPHRYSSRNGFDNPSIFCADLMKLVTHIQVKTLSVLPEEMRREMRLATLAEIKDHERHRISVTAEATAV